MTTKIGSRDLFKSAHQKSRDKFGVFDSDNEVNVSMIEMEHLSRIFERNPAILAARSVLHAQLLSSGLLLKRNDETIDVTPAFRSHLDTVWTTFARNVIDHFCVYGFCVVQIESDKFETATNTIRERKRKRDQTVQNFNPYVAQAGSYRLAFKLDGDHNMCRSYRVYREHEGANIRDDSAIVYLNSEPDLHGRIVSPVASVFRTSHFIDEMMTLAGVAERSRARPPYVTQQRPKTVNSGPVPTDMYYVDSESQSVAQDLRDRDHIQHIESLQMSLAISNRLNEMRMKTGNTAQSFGTTQPSTNVEERASIALPENQELARTDIAQCRSDLVELWRLAIDQMCTAMGVPSSLLFEARRTGQSDSQMALLNATIQQLGRKVDTVLTNTYNDIYAVDGLAYDNAKTTGVTTQRINDSDDDELQLVTTTSPLSSSSEVLALYSGGLADYEAAAPLALHTVGISASAIEAMMKRHEVKEKEEQQRLAIEQSQQDQMFELQVKESEARIKQGNASTNADSKSLLKTNGSSNKK